MRFTRGTRSNLGQLCAALLTATSFVNSAVAYDLDPDDSDSVKSIAKDMVTDLMTFYNGSEPGGTPGLLPDPYYWWEAGAMMGTLIDYWYYTGDDSYVDITKQALLFQVGDHDDYMPRNQTLTEGNDDQGFWGLAVMSAAENNFPHPDQSEPQWLGLAQAVFNTQAARWDMDHCNGGLRWQIFNWNQGWEYKNSISQGCFFALAARLALYTGNSSYADWAEKTWDWSLGAGFIDDESWYVYDGAHTPTNCTDIVPYQFSYNAGVFILGVAAMYNYTEDDIWRERLDNLLDGAHVFFTGDNNDIMQEVACEPVDRCNVDQQSFKAYLSRWLAAITKWAPHTYDVVMPRLRASATAAASLCTGGDNGRMCGLKWDQDEWDGTSGVGQQMSALEVTLSVMINERGPAYRADNGGESVGNPGGGGDDIGRTEPEAPNLGPITGGDRAGAAILTTLILGGLFAFILFIFVDETSDKTAMQQIRGFQTDTSAHIAAFAAAGGAGAVMAALGKKTSETSSENEKRNSSQPLSNTSFRVSYNGSSNLGGDTPIPPSVDFPRLGGESPSMGFAARPVPQETDRRSRRLSNMPRGWPHNPNLRKSTVEPGMPGPNASQDYLTADEDDARPRSATDGPELPPPALAQQGSRETLRHKRSIDSSASVPLGSGPRPQVSQDYFTADDIDSRPSTAPSGSTIPRRPVPAQLPLHEEPHAL